MKVQVVKKAEYCESCPSCGASLVVDSCSKCWGSLHPNDIFCRLCGGEIDRNENSFILVTQKEEEQEIPSFTSGELKTGGCSSITATVTKKEREFVIGASARENLSRSNYLRGIVLTYADRRKHENILPWRSCNKDDQSERLQVYLYEGEKNELRKLIQGERSKLAPFVSWCVERERNAPKKIKHDEILIGKRTRPQGVRNIKPKTTQEDK